MRLYGAPLNWIIHIYHLIALRYWTEPCRDAYDL